MKVSYSAVVLDEASQSELREYFKQILPGQFKTWEIICHHMTICMGELPKELKKDIGQEVQLVVSSVAYDDKVAAVGVGGYTTKNKHPHITLAVNRSNGGKPVMSNDLTQWTPVSLFHLKGTVQELAR